MEENVDNYHDITIKVITVMANTAAIVNIIADTIVGDIVDDIVAIIVENTVVATVEDIVVENIINN
jgi:hypothetical protein